MAFTIKGGKFSTTDDDKTIRQPRVVEDPVIDILDDRTQALSNIQYVQPQRPAPVNVGMMPERRGDVTIPMQSSESKRVQPGQQFAILRNLGLNSANYQMDPKDNLGFVQSPFITKRNPVGSVDDVLFTLSLADAAGQPINYGGGEGQLAPANVAYIPDLNTYDDVGNIMNPAAPLGRNEGIAGINTQGGYLGDQLFNTPTDLGASIDPYEQMGDNLLGGDASTVYGINPIVKRIAEFQGYDMDTDEGVRKYLADTQQTMKDSEDALEARRKDQDREMAAMLAAQQQQPIDPCPEGYRMDPVSRVCVPTDDTTDPVGITKRTYETMTEPVADYTAKTEFTVPTVTLPDILTYE